MNNKITLALLGIILIYFAWTGQTDFVLAGGSTFIGFCILNNKTVNIIIKIVLFTLGTIMACFATTGQTALVLAFGFLFIGSCILFGKTLR